MVSKKFNAIFMQACNVHVSCPVIFIAASTVQWQLINNGISKPASPPSLSHSKRGITACRHRPPLANHVKKPSTVSLSVALCFSPPFPMFSHSGHFQLNFRSVAGVDGHPLVHKGITARCRRPLLTNVTAKPTAVSLSVVFIPPVPNIISWQPFSINLLFCWQCRPPSLSR